MNTFGQSTTVPTYDHLDGVSIVDLSVNFSGVDTDEIPISIGVDPNNFVYVLTLGNGIQKRNPDGSIAKRNFITGLRSPLDFAIDANGLFYVADYSEDGSCGQNGKIKIYNSSGNLIDTFYTGFYRPLSVDVDTIGNIYVAEYNQPGNGCESDELSRVRIYSRSGSVLSENRNVIRPYRIAVNSNKKVYLSQEGDGDPAVLTLNESLGITGKLPNIQSPGSVSVDSFDFVHVAEFAGRVDFSKFINFDNLDFGEIQDIAKEIDRGIDANDFSVKIYSANGRFEYSYKEEIDFPVDIAFNLCDIMYVDNFYVDGRNVPFLGYFPEDLEFDLEIYERTPGFDEEAPVFTCPSNDSFDIAEGESTVRITYAEPTVSDKNEFTLMPTGPASGSLLGEGTYDITYTATDICGNSRSCTFKITVNSPDVGENTPPEIECQEDIIVNNNVGLCGAKVNFALPTVTDDGDTAITPTRIDDNLQLVAGSEFPLGKTTIIFEADDGVNDPVECSFDIVVSDTEFPNAICIPPGKEYRLENGSLTITPEEIDDGSYDNCEIASIELARSVFDSPGTHTLSLIVTDTAGNSTICNTNIEIWDEEKTPPEAICNNLPDVILDENGMASITPQEVYNGTEDLILSLSQQEFTCDDIGDNAVTLTVEDRETGLTDTCVATITLKDETNPVISNCPTENLEFTIQEGGNIPLRDYTNQITVDDNCDSNLNPIQSPEPGTPIEEDQVVTISVTDNSGNISEVCSFTVKIKVEETYQFQCIGNLTVKLGEEVQNSAMTEIETSEFITSDISNLDFEIQVQQFTCEDIGTFDLVVNATDRTTQESYTCAVEVTVEDAGKPLIICPADIQQRDIPTSGIFILPEFGNQNNIVDNCADFEELEITQIPVSGTEFTEAGDVTVLITAEDPSGNIETCEVIYRLTETATSTFDCTSADDFDPITAGMNCSPEIPDFTDSISNIQNITNPEVRQTTSISGNIVTVILSVFDGNDQKQGECRFDLPIVDLQAPQIIGCDGLSETVNLEQGESYSIPNFLPDLTISDNCDPNPLLEQIPTAGTPITESTQVIIRATDAADNVSICEIEIEVVINTSEGLDIQCPIDKNVEVDENCSFILGDYRSEINIFRGELTEELIQTPAPGTTITDPSVQLSFTGTNGTETDTCFFTIFLRDRTAPQLNCTGTYTLSVPTEGAVNLEATQLVNSVSDACDNNVQLSLSQNEFSAEDAGNRDIIVTATDASGNISTCTVLVNVISDEVPNQVPVAIPNAYSTPFETILTVDAPGVLDNDTDADGDNLSANLDTDVVNGALTLNPDGSFTYIPNTGFSGSDRFTYSVSDGNEQSAGTTVNIIVFEDGNTSPAANDDFYTLNQDEELQLEAPGVLVNDNDPGAGQLSATLVNGVSNGTLNLQPDGSFSYIPNTGFVGTDSFTYIANNGSQNSNVATVTISVEGDVNTNTPPEANPESYTTPFNTILNVEAPGILANDSDPENDEITAVLANDVLNGSLEFNADGSFSYTPLNGFSGEDRFTYYVNDGELNSETVRVDITVLPEGLNFQCNERVIIELDENGEALLPLELLYNGEVSGLTLDADANVFTCDDLGENTVNLNYSGSVSGSCSVIVEVVDRIAPVLNLQDIDIDLDQEGNASISFEDIDTGSFDNCNDDVIYTLSRTDFDCKYVGANEVTVTATDASGNSVSETITVTVFAEAGICGEQPVGSEYIFVYPNPNTGNFKVATPTDITISRIEVFDHRGRFIIAKDFDSSVLEYAMEIGPLQEAVYVLKLITNKGVETERIIFKY